MTDYQKYQMELCALQLQESYNIMCSTNNPETFFSRREFAIKCCNKLDMLEKAFGRKLPKLNSDYFADIYNKNSASCLYHCYCEYLKKARSELKKPSSIQARIKKFWEIVELHNGKEATAKIRIAFESLQK